ncbi:ATP-dependent zinc protease [Botrimarina sp.]|uniref:ATP-dependent zinc protease family protein n=1 Tax=Botrimarina sp. TaxID=2795802 RepID=UPI0032ED508F
MSADSDSREQLPHLGWLEWCALPELGVPLLQAKVDTGAKTSSLHAEELEIVDVGGKHVARFLVHTRRAEYRCECPVHDERHVKSSSGHEELRVVVRTLCVLGRKRWRIELTLTDRTAMKFPMLLGRGAMAERFAVDPSAVYLRGRPKTKRKPRAS